MSPDAAQQKLISQYYIEGILEGRKTLQKQGLEVALEELANINSTLKGFPASSPVGQMLRGERDFWLNQVNRKTRKGGVQ